MRVHVFGSTRPGNSLINLARTSEDLALALTLCKVDAVFFAFGTNSNTVPLSTNRAIFIRPPSNTVFFGGGAELSNKIEELDRSNNDLNNLLESTQIATVFLDRNLVIRSFTPAVTKIFSLIPSDRGRPLTDIVSPIAHQDLQTDVHAVFERGEVIERGIRLVDGEEHYLVRILPYRGHANAIEGVVVTFVDVTNITAAQDRQKTLAAELSHRVRNSLAVVASLAERTLEPGEAKDRFLARLDAKARAHDLLSEADWTDLPLRDVILAQLGPHPVGDGANVTLSGPPVLLKPRTALFLSLVFHELIANAAKYGALSVPDGRIEASWVIEGNSPGHLTLTWVQRRTKDRAVAKARVRNGADRKRRAVRTSRRRNTQRRRRWPAMQDQPAGEARPLDRRFGVVRTGVAVIGNGAIARRSQGARRRGRFSGVALL